MNARIKYLDVAKFIGIFCIYLGHFTGLAGKAYLFVFSFHVPLFFFLSGFSENLSKELPFGKYLFKNIKNLLLPFYFFAFISLFVDTIIYDTHVYIIPNLIEIFKGCIRNHYIAYSLWFLTCLFVIKILFYFLLKVVKSKWLNLLICAVLFFASELFISSGPRLIYNIDSACYYILFYALGYYGYKPIHFILDWKEPINKVICSCVGTVLFIYATLLFFGKDLLMYINTGTFANFICSIFKPCFVIILVLIISKVFEDVELFNALGKNTLFLCGSEYLIKIFVPLCLQITGLELVLPNPLAAYIYTFFLLILCKNTLIPIEKCIFKKIFFI